MYAAAVPGVLGAVLLSWSGHAASGTDATLGVAIDVLHGWATAAWLGGLVMLLALGLPLLGRMAEGPRLALGAGIVVRFSSVAVAAVVLLVVTGVYRALAELPSLASLWTTSYGVALLVKLIVFAVMLVLAAWNRLVLHPRLERAALGLGSAAPGDGIGALRTSVRAEVALGAVVMLAVAVLVGLVPPT
jgi:putative copper export protein